MLVPGTHHTTHILYDFDKHMRDKMEFSDAVGPRALIEIFNIAMSNAQPRPVNRIDLSLVEFFLRWCLGNLTRPRHGVTEPRAH